MWHMVKKSYGHLLMLCICDDPPSTLSFQGHFPKFADNPHVINIVKPWYHLFILCKLLSPFPNLTTFQGSGSRFVLFEIIIIISQDFAARAHHACYTVPYAAGIHFEISYYKVTYKLVPLRVKISASY